jgi:hypothetical protein
MKAEGMVILSLCQLMLSVICITCLRAAHTQLNSVNIHMSVEWIVVGSVIRHIDITRQYPSKPLVSVREIPPNQVRDVTRVFPSNQVRDVAECLPRAGMVPSASMLSAPVSEPGPPVIGVSIVPVSPVMSCANTWIKELKGDPSYDFIVKGVTHGFELTDNDCIPPLVECNNYKSTLLENRDLVEAQIKKEILLGRYIVSDTRPDLVSALGAVPKGKTKIRLIHDLSRPFGGLNQCAENTSVHYPTLSDATKFMSTKSFLAKLDLSEAYRSIPVHSSCFKYTGLSWQFADSGERTFMFDSRLPFGASLSCKIFQTMTDSIVRMLKKRGINSIGYIDDFLLVCDSFDECKQALDVAISLVQSLGLTVNFDKVEGPVQQITFLGIHVDCVNRTLALPAKKLLEVKELVKSWLF